MAVAKVVQTAYTFDTVEGDQVIVANQEYGVSIQVGDNEPFTVSADDSVALPKLFGKLNRESGRVAVKTRGPRTPRS